MYIYLSAYPCESKNQKDFFLFTFRFLLRMFLIKIKATCALHLKALCKSLFMCTKYEHIPYSARQIMHTLRLTTLKILSGSFFSLSVVSSFLFFTQEKIIPNL